MILDMAKHLSKITFDMCVCAVVSSRIGFFGGTKYQHYLYLALYMHIATYSSESVYSQKLCCNNCKCSEQKSDGYVRDRERE